MISIDRAIQLLDLGYTLDQVRAAAQDQHTVQASDTEAPEPQPAPQPAPQPEPQPELQTEPQQNNQQLQKLTDAVLSLQKTMQAQAVRTMANSTPAQQTVDDILKSILQPDQTKGDNTK